MKSLDSIRREWNKPLPPPRLPQPPPKKGKKKTRHGNKKEEQLSLPFESERQEKRHHKTKRGRA